LVQPSPVAPMWPGGALQYAEIGALWAPERLAGLPRAVAGGSVRGSLRVLSQMGLEALTIFRPRRYNGAREVVRMPNPIPASPAADWLPVPIFLAAGIIFAAVSLLIPRLLSPKHPTPDKSRPYECGERVSGEFWQQFHIGYYLFALVFIIFDVEVVFLWPWVRVVGGRLVQTAGLGMFAFLDMLVFVAILVVALVYAWKKGVLRWE